MKSIYIATLLSAMFAFGQEFKQAPSIGNSSEYDLNSLLAGLKKEAQEVKLRYEYEVYLSEQYAMPKELTDMREQSLTVVEELGRGTYRSGRDDIVNNASELMYSYAKTIAPRLISEKNGEAKIKRFLQMAALFGVKVDDKCYVGPWHMCMMEAYSNLQYSDKGSLRLLDDNGYAFSVMRQMIGGRRNILSGKVEDPGSSPAFNYQVSIEDRNGLPYKVKCIIDFSPSKGKLIKKQD